MIQYKSNGLELKDLDMTKRVVSGYFSSFGNKDSDGDIIVKGAFKKSIAENKSRIAHLWQHDIWTPIGKLQELREDGKGLYFESKLSESTKGNDALILYQEGIIKEHSIGFRIMQDEYQESDNTNYIKEVYLYEGSTVTFGANPNTPVTGIKSETKEDLSARLDNLQRFFKSGNVTDETFRLLEMEVESIKTLIKALDEPQKKHSEPQAFNFEKFNKFLKN